MKHTKAIYITLILILSVPLISAPTVDRKAVEIEPVPAFPEKGSGEYWVVRSQAMTEFIPFLTKKRSEVKKIQKMLADYLLKIDKASDFSKQDIPVKFDAKVYTQILRINHLPEDLGVDLPEKRPSWDQIVEVAMRHALDEGVFSTEVETTELQQYVDICKKKEAYGQKVRSDMRKSLDQCARVWTYLDKIGKLDDFKSFAADMVLQKKSDAARRKAEMQEMRKDNQLARIEEAKERDFQERMDRKEFRSTERERRYESRQDRLRYRQSRLDERYVNSRSYYY